MASWWRWSARLCAVAFFRLVLIFFFFFSSRRRHTRYWRDWSSDVCSSSARSTASSSRGAPWRSTARSSRSCRRGYANTRSRSLVATELTAGAIRLRGLVAERGLDLVQRLCLDVVAERRPAHAGEILTA